MTTFARDLRRGDCQHPTNLQLLGDPLGFIHEDHLRERHICTTLDKLAADEPPSRADLDDARDFLGTELPLHIADEEEDLFPLLRRRCTSEDEIDRVIARLQGDHAHADFDTPAVTALVRDAHEGLDEAGRDALRRYANHARRHLILENAIVLPFARLRLTRSDLETLRLRMMQRRGIGGPAAGNALP